MKVVFALIPLIVTVMSAPSSLFSGCGGKPADVVFVVDSSSSIWQYDYYTYVLPFVRNVTAMFDIGPDPSQSRVGVLTFGTTYYPRFHLNTQMDKKTLLQWIMAIDMSGGSTYTADALKYVTEQMFTKRRGSRPDVDHIVIVLTDGESRDMEKTAKAAAAAHQKGLQVFAIGVGNDVDSEELKNIASEPSSKFMFEINDFRALETIKEKLAIRACETTTTSTTTTTEATTTPTTTTTTTTTTPVPSTSVDPFIADTQAAVKNCGGKPADVYFILDSSTSIWKKDFYEKVVKFVHDVSEIFDIGAQKTRVGIVSYSDNVTAVFGLDEYNNQADLLDAMSEDVIPYLTGGTNTADAIKYVTEVGFSPFVARRSVAHVAIIITDGMSKDPEATMREAEAARRDGIYMFAIGVSQSVDELELNAMASQPSKDFVFSVSNFEALNTIKNLLAVKTCLISSEEEPRDQTSTCDLLPADIVFGFDSFAMGQRRSHKVVDVISSVTRQMSYGSAEDYRFSVLSTACSRHSDLPLTDIRLSERALGDLKSDMTSELHRIIMKMRRHSFSLANNARQEAKKIGVLFLDESAELNMDRIVANAKRAKYSGVEIYAVTLSSMKQSFVREIVSDSVKVHLIQANENDDVTTISRNIRKQLC